MTKIMLFLVILGHSCTRISPYINMHAVLGVRGYPLGLKRKFKFSHSTQKIIFDIFFAENCLRKYTEIARRTIFIKKDKFFKQRDHFCEIWYTRFEQIFLLQCFLRKLSRKHLCPRKCRENMCLTHRSKRARQHNKTKQNTKSRDILSK